MIVAVFIINAAQFGRSQGILLVVRVGWNRIEVLPVLPAHQRRQNSLVLLVPTHLVQDVLVVLFVQVRDLRQAHLVPAVLVFNLLQVVLAPPNYVRCVVLVPAVRKGVTGDVYEVGRLVLVDQATV